METTLNIAKALSDGSRMRVLVALLHHDALCVCQIVEMLGLSGATVSRHMSILQNARLVQNRKEGRWVYYFLVESFPEQIREWLLESLANSAEIKTDRVILENVLSCDPENLCRRQKNRKACHNNNEFNANVQEGEKNE